MLSFEDILKNMKDYFERIKMNGIFLIIVGKVYGLKLVLKALKTNHFNHKFCKFSVFTHKP